MITTVSGCELETMRLAANGFCTKEIARQRGVSYATVNFQLDTVRDKLGARDTKHAVAILATRGLIVADDVAVLV